MKKSEARERMAVLKKLFASRKGSWKIEKIGRTTDEFASYIRTPFGRKFRISQISRKQYPILRKHGYLWMPETKD